MQSDLVKRDMEKNQARFYAMAVLPDLFGEWTLRQEWGRIGAHGQIRLDLFRSHTEAEDALLTLENRKRRGDITWSRSNTRCCDGPEQKTDTVSGLAPALSPCCLFLQQLRFPHDPIHDFTPLLGGAFHGQCPLKPPRPAGCDHVR